MLKEKAGQKKAMFCSHCHDSRCWRAPTPEEHGSRWGTEERQPAAGSSQTRAKCASPWQTSISFKLTLRSVIKYNKRGHLLNALAHISGGSREHCVAACWSGCLGTICQPDGSTTQPTKFFIFYFSKCHTTACVTVMRRTNPYWLGIINGIDVSAPLAFSF